MRFTVKKSDLIQKLAQAMGTVSNKNTITAIEGVLIEANKDNSIQISTYDMNKGYRAKIDAVCVERSGKYIINAQRLFQTVKVLPDDEITFEVNERLNCDITCDKASFSMFALNGADFPNLPDLTADEGFTVSADILKKIIGKVQHSIAEQDNRPMLCGAFFKISNEGLEAVSCDSYTLSKCNVGCEVKSINGNEEINYSFIVPGHALGEMGKILQDSEDEDIKFYLSRKHAIIKSAETIFFTRVIDSEYIDYNRIIPKDNDIIVILDRERLLSGLERANIIAEEKIQGSGRSYVKITLNDQYLNLTSSSINGGVSDEMDCVHEGKDIEIGFNCRYLINSVKVLESENIRITLKSATQAITIEPDRNDDRYKCFYMILPVRMSS